jgi:hypothetical protein
VQCDVHLFSNVLHDWDKDRVELLLEKSFAVLPKGGMIIVHDDHINAEKTGPLPVAEYSALLMTITEGKCYSEKEMGDFWAGRVLAVFGTRRPKCNYCPQILITPMGRIQARIFMPTFNVM